MSLDIETNPPYNSPLSDGFDMLDEAHALHSPTPDDHIRYGRYAVTDTSLLETPPFVYARGEVLTNPSQIETVNLSIEGEQSPGLFAYFRQEPTSCHLGNTASVPYLIRHNDNGDVILSEFVDALTLPGEDPRLIRGLKIVGPSGKVRSGWCVSTVVVTPTPDNPEVGQGTKQVFYWGESLNRLEPVAEVDNVKSTCLFPVAKAMRDDSDTTIDIFGRPHPHITYSRVSSLTQLTKESILNGVNLTAGFLPPGNHAGVNMVKAVPGHPDLRELDIHEANDPFSEKGKILHYRLGRYGVNLATGKLTALGVIASRSDFPDAAPKPPENDVYDYHDVLYGSMGNAAIGLMVTGVSDRHVGLARIVRA